MIERTGANQYQIKSGYRSVFIKYMAGGYYMSGGTSPLSGGDAYGILNLNECTHFEFESSAFIQFGDTAGYVNINVANALLSDADVRGSGTSAAAVTYSFVVAAENATLRNCKTSNRYTNVNYTAFAGGNYRSARFEGCKVATITCDALSKTIRGFYQCYNISNGYINNITVTNGTHIYSISESYNIQGCINYNLSTATGSIRGIDTCTNVSNCINDTLAMISGEGNNIGIYNSYNVSSCLCTNLTNAGATGASTNVGIYACYNVSACYIHTMSSANGANTYGCWGAYYASACYVNNITANTGNAFGFYSCQEIAGCKAGTITSTAGTENGFNTCTYGAALFTAEAANASNDYIDTADVTIVNKNSTGGWWT